MRTSTLVAAAFAGFIGGTIGGGASGSHFTTVYAQGPDPGVEILHSKNFVLLDGAGHKRGEWKIDPSGLPVLRLFDAQGRVIWDTTGTPRAHLTHQP
jgi:hypothetical protein